METVSRVSSLFLISSRDFVKGFVKKFKARRVILLEKEFVKKFKARRVFSLGKISGLNLW